MSERRHEYFDEKCGATLWVDEDGSVTCHLGMRRHPDDDEPDTRPILIRYVAHLGAKVDARDEVVSKYIRHIQDCEGINYLDKINTEPGCTVEFSDEEIDYLARMEHATK